MHKRLNFFDRLISRRLILIEAEGSVDGAGGEVKEETQVEKIAAIAKKVEAEMKGDEEKPKVEKKEEKEEKEEKDEEEEEKEELSPTEIAEAKKLFKVLNNPETALDALKIMVKSAGMDLTEKATKKEEKEVAKTIKDVVKAKLGAKYEFLSEDLGDLLQELFDSQVTEKTKDIRDQLQADKSERVTNELSKAFEAVTESYEKVDIEILKEVDRIQKDGEVHLSPKLAPDKYFRALFAMAAENLGVTLTKKVISQKETGKGKPPLEKKRDVFSRLNAHTTGTTHKDGVKGTQVKSLKDIIQDAADKVEAEMSQK